MAGEEYWVVLYKAIADFGDLMRKAAEAKAALDALGKSAGEVTTSQIAGEQKLIDLRKQEVTALKDEASAATVTAEAYKKYNVQALYGGRSDMQSHLGDMERELQYETLLNRQRWLGFTTPQQAYAWRQNEYNQRLLMNRAEWAGYTTADQYIAYLQKQTAAFKNMNEQLVARAQLYKQNTDAALGYYNALGGTHKSITTLGPEGNLAQIQALNDALVGLPDQVATKVSLDDAGALAALAAYKAALASVPRLVTSTDVVNTVGGGGSFKAPGEITSDTVVFTDAQAKSQLDAWIAELRHVPPRVEVTADFNDAAAMAKAQAFYAFLEQHRNFGTTETLDILTKTGAAGGGGGPPPVLPPGAGALPNPNDENASAAAARNLANAMQDVAQSEDKATSSTRNFYGWWRLLGGNVALFGGLLPGILGSIAAWHVALDSVVEVLAVLIPAAIALGAAVAAAVPTVQAMYQSLSATYTVSKAFNLQIPGLSGGFQKVAASVQPNVYVLFGEALAVINRNTGTFQTLAKGASQVLDNLGARAELALGSKGASGFAELAVSDLQGLGNVVGNVFGTFGNFLKVLPGYAELLLRGLQGVTGAVEQLTGSGLVQWFLQIGLAAHGAILWGGLLGTAFLALGSPLGRLGNLLAGLSNSTETATSKLEDGASRASKVKAGWTDFGNALPAIAANLGNLGKDAEEAGTKVGLGSRAANLFSGALGLLTKVPVWGWVALGVAALTGLVFWLGTSKDSTQKWIDSLNAGIAGQKTFTGVLTATEMSIKAVNDRLAQTPATVDAAAGVWVRYEGSLKQVNVAHGELANASQQLTDTQRTELSRIGQLTQMFGSQGAALGAMNAVGIKASDIATANAQAWARDVAELKAYQTAITTLAGYQGGQALAAQNALQQANDDQVKAIQQVTQAEDQLLNRMIGGEQAFISYQQAVNQTAADAKNATFGITGLGKAGLTVASDFYNQVIPGLQKMSDAAQTQFASTSQLTVVMATGAKQALAFAGSNEAARVAIVDVINNALGPGTVSLKTLNTWVGKNSTSVAGLSNLMGVLQVQASGLAGVLGQDLAGAFQQDLIHASGADKALQQYTLDLVNNTANTAAGRQARAQLIRDLMNSGLSYQQAKNWVDSHTSAIAKNSAELAATRVNRTNLNADIATIIQISPRASSDIANLTMAIHDHGTTSNAYRSARAQLIADLERAGVNAKTATGLVDGLTGSIRKVPASKQVDIAVRASGSGSVSFTSHIAGGTQVFSHPPSGGLNFFAAGGTAGRINGYAPNSDTRLAAVSPGEYILTPEAAAGIGYDRLDAINMSYSGRAPARYSDGGQVLGLHRPLTSEPNFAANAAEGFAGASEGDFASGLISWLKSTINQAAAQSASGAHAGPGGGAPSANARLAQRLVPGWGSGAEWFAWNQLAMDESGWNQFATNPTSGAYGIAQALPFTKYPRAGWPAWAGGSSNPTAQILWMRDYIAGRYGDPLAALGHENAFHWYASGGPVGIIDMFMASGGAVQTPAGGSGGTAAYSAAWAADVPKALTAWRAFAPAVEALIHAPRPPGTSTKAWTSAWNDWVADRAIAQKSELLLQKNIDYFLQPSKVTKANWDAFRSPGGLGLMLGILAGATPAKQFWLSKTPPFPYLAKTKLAGQLANARARYAPFYTDMNKAYADWSKLQGVNSTSSASPPPVTPGIIGAPPVTTGGTVNIAPYVTLGGPGQPVAGPGAMGFANGGGFGLNQVASMFSVGIAMPGGVLPVSMPAAMVGQLRQSGDTPSRTLGAAAAATGGRVGLNVENLTVNNPVPEPPSQSITRSANRLAFLAGRGPV